MAAAQTGAEASRPAPSEASQAALQKAEQIDALMKGQLDSEIDADSLFAPSFLGNGTASLRWVLTMIADDKAFRSARKDPAILEGVTPGESTLILAQATFLRLPEARRIALVSAHQRKQEKQRAAENASARKAGRLADLQQQAAGLRDFLAGQPAPASSLTLDLLDPEEAALNPGRRVLLLGEQPAEQGTAENADDLAAAIREVDDLRQRILALAPAELERLSNIQIAALSEHRAEAIAVEEARQKLVSAKASAALARTETDRLYAAERQRLLTAQQALAKANLDLSQHESAIAKIGESALGWRRQVAEVPGVAASEEVADQLYPKLIEALRNVRRDLSKALARPVSAEIEVPLVPVIDPLLPRNDRRIMALEKLRSELAIEAAQLDIRAKAIGWGRRTAMYDAMSQMNRARLVLITSLSRPARARVTGFDEEGLAQVRREFNQIYLTIRYNIAYGSARISNLSELVLQPRSGHVFALFQLLAILLAFRIWRKQGDTVLAGMERSYAGRRPPTLVSSVGSFAAGLLRKLRRPLDWLLLLFLLRWIFPSATDYGVIRIIWIVLSWLLSGAVVIRLLDALAKGARRDDPRAELRGRSLRLVVGVVLGVGLVLSLTAASVGRGAIYNWVLTFCWLLIIPVIVTLIRWWRDRIDTLAAVGAPNNGVLAWSAAHHEGITGILGRIAAGFVLMIQGAQAIVSKRISQLALIREISGQRAREKAAARVIADEASGRYEAISLTQAERLSPHGRPLSDAMSDNRDGKPLLPPLSPGRIVAVIGARGLGKTTAMERMLDADLPALPIMVATGINGYDGIIASLAEQLGCKPSETAIASKLSTGLYHIAIDDIQRAVIPAIGGLEGFDKLIAFVREHGGQAGWVLGIGDHAWNYLSRARADRSMFDAVAVLPRWHVAELRGLIERRTRQAEMAPSFSLEVSNAGSMLFDSNIPPQERAKREFFEELTEYCDGNPAVALEFWRRSLFEDRNSGSIAVRTYKTPDVAAILSLPKTTLFVLRAILQMEIATSANVTQSTDLSPVIVSEAIRALQNLGVIIETGDAYRLTLFWLIDVRRLLERQNLIVKVAP